MAKPKAAASTDETTIEPDGLEPTQAEIDAWAAEDRARREAWLKGPTEEERAAYARHARTRRLAETFDEGEERIEHGVRQGVRMGRDTQLAAEGAMLVFFRWYRRTFRDLVQAGRAWEEETALPNRRRRISLDDEPE